MFPLLETMLLLSIEFVDKDVRFCNIFYMTNEDIHYFQESAQLFKALGHPVRLAMVEALDRQSWCVCELADTLGINKSAASKHLSLLQRLGVIQMEKEGTRVNCTLKMNCVMEMLRCAQKKH